MHSRLLQREGSAVGNARCSDDKAFIVVTGFLPRTADFVTTSRKMPNSRQNLTLAGSGQILGLLGP